VAVPARHVVGVVTAHLERARDHVLQHLVQCMADMDIAVRIGRAVMQHEQWTSLRLFAQALIKAHLGPTRDKFRLPLWKARAHRKIRLRQVQGLGIVQLLRCFAHYFRHMECDDRGSRRWSYQEVEAPRAQASRPSTASRPAEGRATNSPNLKRYTGTRQHGGAFKRNPQKNKAFLGQRPKTSRPGQAPTAA